MNMKSLILIMLLMVKCFQNCFILSIAYTLLSHISCCLSQTLTPTFVSEFWFLDGGFFPQSESQLQIWGELKENDKPSYILRSHKVHPSCSYETWQRRWHASFGSTDPSGCLPQFLLRVACSCSQSLQICEQQVEVFSASNCIETPCYGFQQECIPCSTRYSCY